MKGVNENTEGMYFLKVNTKSNLQSCPPALHGLRSTSEAIDLRDMPSVRSPQECRRSGCDGEQKGNSCQSQPNLPTCLRFCGRNGKGWVKEGVMWQAMYYCTSCTHLGVWDKLGPHSSSKPATTEEGHPVLRTISALGIQVWHTQVVLSSGLRCLQWRKTFSIDINCNTPSRWRTHFCSEASREWFIGYHLVLLWKLSHLVHGSSSSDQWPHGRGTRRPAAPRWCQHWLLWISTCQQLRPSQFSCGSASGLMEYWNQHDSDRFFFVPRRWWGLLPLPIHSRHLIFGVGGIPSLSFFPKQKHGKESYECGHIYSRKFHVPNSGVLRICLAQANTRWYDHLADSTPQGHEPESPVPLIVECMFGSLVPHVGVTIFGSEGHL